MRVLILLCLLTLCGCSSNSSFCPKREPFTGETYGDAVAYLGSLERQYDSCSK